MTYGEKAVGLTFNPSNDPDVDEVKKLYAQIIDICFERRESAPRTSADFGRLYSIAITQAQQAQMWAVKAITWKDE